MIRGSRIAIRFRATGCGDSEQTAAAPSATQHAPPSGDGRSIIKERQPSTSKLALRGVHAGVQLRWLKGFLKDAPEADFDEYYDKPTTRS